MLGGNFPNSSKDFTLKFNSLSGSPNITLRLSQAASRPPVIFFGTCLSASPVRCSLSFSSWLLLLILLASTASSKSFLKWRKSSPGVPPNCLKALCSALELSRVLMFLSLSSFSTALIRSFTAFLAVSISRSIFSMRSSPSLCTMVSSWNAL